MNLTEFRRTVRFVFILVVFLAENGIHITEHDSCLQQTTQVIVPDLCHLRIQRFCDFRAIEKFEYFPQEKVTAGDFMMFGAEEE